MTIALAAGAGIAPAWDLVAAPTGYTFCTYNTHLFGRTGHYHEVETGFVYQDEQRAAEIATHIRELEPDVVGLTEVWDDQLGREIGRELADLYPYRVGSPAARGIEDLVAGLSLQWPRLSGRLVGHIEGMVRYFAQSHYGVLRRDPSLLERALGVLSEDFRFRALKGVFSLPHAWGAGLLLLSKHPLSGEAFFPHPAAADLERFAGKGVLQADVTLPAGETVTVLLTHMQEGNSRQAVAARHRQMGELKELISLAPHPVVAMGDFNVQAEERDVQLSVWRPTREYRRMMGELDLADAYRTVHPDAAERPGITYDHDNPLAVRFGVEEAPEGKKRIDFVLAGRPFRAVAARVLADAFVSAGGESPLSDHYPVMAELAV